MDIHIYTYDQIVRKMAQPLSRNLEVYLQSKYRNTPASKYRNTQTKYYQNHNKQNNP